MKRSSTEKTKSSKVNIIEVYADNFISEIKRIGNYLEEYNYIGMDTEFPGIVYGLNQFTTDFYYKSLKTNVDSHYLCPASEELVRGQHRLSDRIPALPENS